VKKWWIALGGILLAVAFAILGRDGRRRRVAEDKTVQLLADGSAKALKQAAREAKKAETAKQGAKDAAAATQARLDKIGGNDADMADLLGAWKSEGDRQRSS